jgi:hypothetical protein
MDFLPFPGEKLGSEPTDLGPDKELFSISGSE